MKKILAPILLVLVAIGMLSCQAATTPATNTTITNYNGASTKEVEDFINSHSGTITTLSVYIGLSGIFSNNPISGLVAKAGTLELTDSLSVKHLFNLATVSEVTIPSPYDRLFLYYY